MFKQLATILFFAFVVHTDSFAVNENPKIGKDVILTFDERMIKNFIEDPVVEYHWFLHNDGCYRLYRVIIYLNYLVFVETVDPLHYAGVTRICPYTAEEMSTLC